MADQSQYWQQQQQPGGWQGQQYPTSGWPPQQPPGGAQPPGAGGTETLPPKPKPTPLNPPVMYYNQKWKVPGIMVTTQEEADSLDPAEWVATTSSLAPTSAAAQDQYPKLYTNVNVEPKIINDADEEKALGTDWKQFALPDALCKAAEAANAAAAQKQQQKQTAAQQRQSQGQD